VQRRLPARHQRKGAAQRCALAAAGAPTDVHAQEALVGRATEQPRGRFGRWLAPLPASITGAVPVARLGQARAGGARRASGHARVLRTQRLARQADADAVEAAHLETGEGCPLVVTDAQARCGSAHRASPQP
jgi:hypothetical protein